MRLILLSAAATLLTAPAAFAQTAAAPAPAPAAAAAKYNLDTPIEALVADAKAKTVLDTDIPGLTTHEAYEQFKGMSLRAVQPYSEGKITDQMLVKVEGDLAKLP